MAFRRLVACSFPCAIALGAACAKTPDVSLEVQVPGAVAGNVAWLEVGVIAANKCPSGDTLAGGVPTDGALVHLAFKPGDKTPSLGNLKKGTYAFAAAARAADCSVIASGCKTVDVTDSRDVSIALAAIDNPAGACGAGAVCDQARCVPSNDNSDPSVGAGCSLALVGAGPLGDPLVLGGGTVVGSPAIAATSTGFLIAYREYNPDVGEARISAIPVDNGGGSGAIQTTTLPGQCAMADESDATALAFSGDTGLIAVSRPPCGASGGVDTFLVDATGTVNKSGFNGANGVQVTLSTAKALAAIGGGFALTFNVAGEARVAKANGVLVQGASTFGGAGPLSGAWVAASDKVVGLLAAGGGVAPSDAGAPDDGGAPIEAGPAPSGGTLRLNVAAASADLSALPPPIAFSGSWGSVAADGTRVFVVSDAVGSAVAWQAYDLGKTTPSASDGFGVQGAGRVVYADVAFRGDRVFYAVEQVGGISLVAYTHATTTPAFTRQVYFPNDARIPSTARVDNGSVAIAASDTRVAVVWATNRSLTANDPVGGYAVFACTQ